MNKEERLKEIRDDLKNNRRLLIAICEENRQNILLVLLDNCTNGGIRVEDIAKQVHLSRPAVSHHLKILLENEIVSIRHEGTKNYYHITGVDHILLLKTLLRHIELYVQERKGDME